MLNYLEVSERLLENTHNGLLDEIDAACRSGDTNMRDALRAALAYNGQVLNVVQEHIRVLKEEGL